MSLDSSSIHDIQQQVSCIFDMMIIGVDHDVYGSDDSYDYEHDSIDGDNDDDDDDGRSIDSSAITYGDDTRW